MNQWNLAQLNFSIPDLSFTFVIFFKKALKVAIIIPNSGFFHVDLSGKTHS